MPELPEVETVKEILKEMVVGKKIHSIHIFHKQTIAGDPNEFGKTLIGATITDFSRVGKYIVFHFDKPYIVASHLRMEGKYFLRNINEKPSYHDMLTFDFGDGTYLAYNDTRRFGTLELVSVDDYLNKSPLNKVGPDPFMMDNADNLIKAYANYSGTIKAALTDQSIMSGLGNIYVDEVLFMLGLHPETPAKFVSKETIIKALDYSKIVLEKAIKAGGSTIKSYHPKEGMSGNFQVSLQVYGKAGEPCPNCGTTIRKIFVNGRGTSYCPHCQKNPALPFILGLTGPIGAGKSTAAKYLESKGYKRISADEIVNELYKNKDVQYKLKLIVPSLKIIDGEIDRASLRDYLIDNQKAKIRVENLIWELVEETFLKKIKRIKGKVVFEVPLLFESKLNDYCDKTLVIDVDENSQVRNLKSRGDNINKAININKSYNKENNKKASFVILNNGSLANLYKELDSILNK